MTRTYTRDDVQTHSDGFRPGRPAVNVKVYGSISDRKVWEQFRKEEEPDEGFTLEWIEENCSDEYLDSLFWHVCEFEFEYLSSYATEDEDAIFPKWIYGSLSVEREGRSGGWAVIGGLPDIEEWDAITLARWRKFERVAKDIANGIPFQMLASIYLNEWEWGKQEAAERERAANQDIATVDG